MFRSLVLCYHAVSAVWPNNFSVAPEAIRRQISGLLRRGYLGVGAKEILAGAPRRVHVTFDDAYTSVLNAIPVLESLRMPATVFACTSYAQDGRPLDVPEVADRLADAPHEMRTLDWQGLRELAERGIEIGSHTVSHPHLPRLADVELIRELTESRTRVEDELERPCRFLAYPFGDDDSRVHAAARQAGYEAAFTLVAKPTHPSLAHYAIPRVDLYRKDGDTRTALKTSLLRHIRPELSRVRSRLRQHPRAQTQE